MKKILFLLLLTVASYGQTYQNPTFGTVKTMTAPTVTTTPHLGTVEANGTISKITPANLPVSTAVQTALDLKKNATSTAVTSTISITNNTTSVTVSAFTGKIVDNSTVPATITNINFLGAVNVVPLYFRTILYVDGTGALQQFNGATSDLSPLQRVDNLFIGIVVFSGGTVQVIQTIPDLEYAIDNRLAILGNYIRNINEGNNISANGANLQVNKGAGTTWRLGSNFATDRKVPDVTTDIAQTPVPSTPNLIAYRNGSGGWTYEPYTGITPQFWDDGSGVKATVANNKFTNVRDYFFNGTNTHVFYLGRTEHATLAAAVLEAEKPNSIVDPATSIGSLIGTISVEKSCTALNNTTLAQFTQGPRMQGGASSGGTSGTQNLQSTYLNSLTPQITTSTVLGAVTIRNGTGADTNTIFQGQNIAGSNTFSVTGAGVIDFSNKQNSLVADGTGVKIPTVDAVNKKVTWVNVREYGALGNGTTDDTAAINSAFAALPASGGVLYFPNGIYHSTTGYTFVGDNVSIIGESMPRVANDLNSLTGGVILRGQVLIDGNNIKVENIGVDFGITYSNTYRGGNGGNALVIHKIGLGSIIKNVTVNNVVGLIRIGDFNDAQAAFHAVLLEGIQFGSANNVTGVGGWFGVVVKATDFFMNGIIGRENDTSSIYIKSNTYAPSNRVTATNLIAENYTARGYTGVLVQASDAEMETVSVSNVTVTGGVTAFRVEAETTNPVVSFSLNGLTARGVDEGVSIRGGVYSPVISNCSVYQPSGTGFSVAQNSVSQNAVEVLANNIRVVPSATTTNAVKIDNTNTKGLLSNINVADADGKTLITGSVIDLQADSDINNYVGVLKRAGVVSDIYRFKGGGTTTSLSNINTTANTRIDFANPLISLGYGYIGSDNAYLQSYNNFNLTANRLDINPFGGDVFFGGNISATNYTGSATLTGTPTAPTATAGTNTTQIATTAFVQANKNKLVGYTVATLPAGTIGDMAYVTDASGFTYNSILVGGGSGVTIAFYDGTNWRAH